MVDTDLGTGKLIVDNKYDDSISSGCVALAHKVMSSGKGEKKDIEGWSAGQICLFLDTIIASEKPLPSDTVANIDHAYDLTSSTNSEVRYRWYQIGIRAEYAPVFPAAAKFVVEQGRMKFVRPLYRSMYRSEKGKALALETFKKNSTFYHSIAAKMIAKDLDL